MKKMKKVKKSQNLSAKHQQKNQEDLLNDKLQKKVFHKQNIFAYKKFIFCFITVKRIKESEEEEEEDDIEDEVEESIEEKA